MIAKHPIRVVAKKTGLSPHLIRIWERRYGAVTPDRSDTNRRLYSDADIEKLRLLHRATDSGESISQIAGLSTSELKKMINDSGPAYTSTALDQDSADPADEHRVEIIMDESMEAIRQLNAVKLEKILLRASVDLSQRVLLGQVLQPLMYKIGDLWGNGDIKVVHEHLASAVVRTLLGEMISSIKPSDSAPVLIATTPRGQLHEFGALIGAVNASFEGWQPVYLGPNMPAEDISHAANVRGASVVMLSIIYPLDDPLLGRELRHLRKLLRDDIAILVGGRGVAGYREILKEIGAVILPDLDSLKPELDLIRSGT